MLTAMKNNLHMSIHYNYQKGKHQKSCVQNGVSVLFAEINRVSATTLKETVTN